MVSNKLQAGCGQNTPRDSAFLLSLLIAALIGLYLLLMSTTTLVTKIWPYDFKRMLEFGLLLFLFGSALINDRLRQQTTVLLSSFPRWLNIGLLAVLLLGIVSAWVNARSALHLANSLSQVALMAVLFIAVIVVAACRRIAGRSFDQLAFAFFGLTLLAVSLQELLGVAAAHAGGAEFNFRISLLHFSFPRFFNQVQSWLIPAIVALPVLFSRYRLVTVVSIVLLGLQWYIVLMTGARGTGVALATAIVFAVIFLPAVRIQTIKWHLGGLLIGIVIFWAVLSSFETSRPIAVDTGQKAAQSQIIRDADVGHEGGQLPGGESSFFRQGLGRPLMHTSGRYWIWKIAIDDARANPLLGIGPMAYACVSDSTFAHPHSFPVQMAAEWGIPAAVLTGLIFFTLFLLVLRQVRSGAIEDRESNSVAAFLLTGCVAAAVHASLSGVLVMPVSQVTGLLVLGLLLGLMPIPDRSQKAGRPWIIASAAVLSLALLVLGNHELSSMEPRAERLSPGQSMYPRIWQNSKVCKEYAVKPRVTN